MRLMARRRDDKKPGPQPEKKARAGSPIQAFIDPVVRAALDAYIEDWNSTHDHKAGVTSTVEAALKKYLEGKGFWPPK